MSKTNRNARREAERARAAAAKLAAERRRRLQIAGAAVGAVLVVIAGFVVARLSADDPAPSAPSQVASASVVTAVSTVPEDVLNEVGSGTANQSPQKIDGQPALERDSKPLVVYIGAEFCPFCAAQRWPMAVALARFGEFEGLKTSHSASDDVYPNTATLSFHGATYTSDYLSFDGVETATNQKSGGSYTALDTLTAEQDKLVKTYNVPPYVDEQSAGSIPFVDLGNKFLMSGSSFSPELLAGKTADQIAKALSDPEDPIAKAVNGSANRITAALCELTEQQPSAVCTAAGVQAAKGSLQ